MNRFGDNTEVPVERTRAELDALLSKHGATQRATYEDEDLGLAAIQFRMSGRMVRLEVRTAPAAKFDRKDWAGMAGCTDKSQLEKSYSSGRMPPLLAGPGQK